VTAARVELGPLGLDAGGHLLVKLALERVEPGQEVEVVGTDAALASHLRAWCSAHGHRFAPADAPGAPLRVGRSPLARARWQGAEQAGAPDPGAVAEEAPPAWGLASRGTWVEAGGPAPRFALSTKDDLWADDAGRLYDRAVAGQWDPATAVPWDDASTADDVVEDAVVQVMAYLVENEVAALVVPARFLGQVHPHFAEVQHVLAAQVADEARHAHVFARRQGLAGRPAPLSTAGGRASLQTLLDEPDWATASFLLTVLGEGTFLSLLGFLERHAPDEATRAVARLVRGDEARHVAFGVAHLERHCALDPALRARLASAVERRHDQLRTTAGLNAEVFDALLVLAAGDRTPASVAAAWGELQALQRDMHEGRQGRLARLGFTPGEADALAALHTRNFM
jgi:hypothetical protein